MMNRLSMKRFPALLVVVFAFSTTLYAQTAWVNGQPYFAAIGGPSASPNASSMNNPTGAVVDSVTGKVFIADQVNNRVLRWASMTATTAEAVLGQSSFTTSSSSNTAAGLDFPSSVCLDNAGHLWVADFDNNRVLRYSNATTFASGASADMVLGQPSFLATGAGTSSTTMDLPSSIAFFNNALWVADEGNNRILRFDNVNSKAATGAAADAEIGQASFTGSASGTTAATFFFPTEVYLDNSGNLWVSDQDNSRVLEFGGARSLPDGIDNINASLVLGQPNFTSSTVGLSQSQCGLMYGVASDTAGRIYICDGGDNDRVLIFNNASSLASGAPANNVLGQPDFVTSGGGGGTTGLSNPFHLSTVNLNGQLFLVIADKVNNRIVFQTPTGILPLSLSDLTAIPQPTGAVLLQWKTSDESSVDGYRLEYGTDGTHFNSVLTIIAAEGNAVNSYSYLHTTPATGNNYYRIKIVSKDGSAGYSGVVVVNIAPDDGAVLLTPNPAKGLVTIAIPYDGNSAVTVVNASGQIVGRMTIAGRTGTLAIGSLAPGIYYVHIHTGDGKRLNATLMKQ